MAIWQYECNIVPKRNNIQELDIEKIVSWEGFVSPKCEITFLREQRSWSKDILQYGDLDKNCIEFIFDNCNLVEIECRIDLRNFSIDFIRKLLEYVNAIQALFYSDGEVYLPIEKEIINKIKKSDAYRFCSNPIIFLTDMEV